MNKLNAFTSFKTNNLLLAAGLKPAELHLPANRVVFFAEPNLEVKRSLMLVDASDRLKYDLIAADPAIYVHFHRKARHGVKLLESSESELIKDGTLFCHLVTYDVQLDGSDKASPTLIYGETPAQTAYVWLEHKMPAMPIYVMERGVAFMEKYRVRPEYLRISSRFREKYFHEIAYLMNYLPERTLLGTAMRLPSGQPQFYPDGELFGQEVNLWLYNGRPVSSYYLLSNPGLIPEFNMLAALTSVFKLYRDIAGLAEAA